MTTPSPKSEAAARAALEAVAGRALSDAEWEPQRARLVAFVTILRDWNHQANERRKCTFDKVVTIDAETCKASFGQAWESLEKAA
jgi:hypothetical protein